MSWFETLGKSVSGAAEFAANPKTYKGAEHLINNAATTMQGGFGALQQDVTLGPIASSIGVGGQQFLNDLSEHPALRIAAGAVPAAMSMNPLVGAAGYMASGLLKKPDQQQLQQQLDQLQDTKVRTDISLASQQARKDIQKRGDIYDWVDTAKKTMVNAPIFPGEAISGIGVGVEALGDLVQGKGFHPLQKYKEEGFEALFEEQKKGNNNKLFLFGQSGEDKLSSIPEEVYSRIPDDVKRDILLENTDSQYDLMAEFEKATNGWESEDIVDKLLLKKYEDGDVTSEKVDLFRNEFQSQLKAREFRAAVVADPWMVAGIEGVPVKIVNKVASSLLKASKIPNKGKNIFKAFGKSKDVLSGKKVPSEIPSMEKGLSEIDDIIKQAETPPVSQPRLSEKEFHTLKKGIIEDTKIPFEQKQQLLKQAENITDFTKVAPAVNKIQSASTKQKVIDLQKKVPTLDNKDAADVLLQEAKTAQKAQVDEISKDIWQKIVARGGGEVAENAPLVSMYTPPQVSQQAGKLVADQAVNIPPIQVEFSNPLQKLFYEISMPWNKAIAKGYGMDFARYQEVTQAITKNFAEPLSKLIFGNFDPDNVKLVKSVMGASGSELAKAATKHTPGTPLIFDNLGAARKLDNLLLKSNRVPAIKASMASVIESAPIIKAPEATMEVADEIITRNYDGIVKHFTSIGIPEATAKKAAVFYNKALERSGLSGAGGLAIAADEGVTAGKAYNVEILNDLDGLDRSIATELHEDFHQMVDYLRIIMEPGNVPRVIKDIIITDLKGPGKKYFVGLIDSLNSIKTHRTVLMDEMLSYFVQTKQEMRKGLFTDNPVSKKFMSLFRKANNGDKEARTLLDNLEGVEQQIRQHGDEVEKGIIKELQDTVLPNGETAWDTVNKLDPTDMKGMLPGANYGPSRTSIGLNQLYLDDSAQRMNRMKEVMGTQEVVYRGAKQKPSTGKVRTNYGSEDQLYGAGSYSSTNPAQAFPYSGAGELTDDIAKKWDPGTADVRAYYPSLERPLFWDEQVPMDIVDTLKNSKNKYIKEVYEELAPELNKGMTMENLPMDLHIILEDVIGLPKEKAGKLLLNELWKKAGYDGFIGPSTETTKGFGKGGLEVVPFEGHNLFERTKELRELGKKSAQRVKKSVQDIDLSDDIEAINNVQNRTKSGINYHINKGAE